MRDKTISQFGWGHTQNDHQGRIQDLKLGVALMDCKIWKRGGQGGGGEVLCCVQILQIYRYIKENNILYLKPLSYKVLQNNKKSYFENF